MLIRYCAVRQSGNTSIDIIIIPPPSHHHLSQDGGRETPETHWSKLYLQEGSVWSLSREECFSLSLSLLLNLGGWKAVWGEDGDHVTTVVREAGCEERGEVMTECWGREEESNESEINHLDWPDKTKLLSKIINNYQHHSPYLAQARDAVFIVERKAGVSGLMFTIIKHDDHQISAIWCSGRLSSLISLFRNWNIFRFHQHLLCGFLLPSQLCH